MTIYAIGMIRIRDRERYNLYRDAFMPILHRHGGRLLAATERPTIEQGAWPYDKLTLIEFDDETSFNCWKNSEEYRAIAADREASTEGAILVVTGFNQPRDRDVQS